jgi:hypothetical protein
MCHHQGFSTPDISDHVAMLDAQAWQPARRLKRTHFVMHFQANQRFERRVVVGWAFNSLPLVAAAAK